MSLKDDMEALGRALDRGAHHAKYWMLGDAAREYLTPEQFDEAKSAQDDILKKAFDRSQQ